jgi:hypothetical protein
MGLALYLYGFRQPNKGILKYFSRVEIDVFGNLSISKWSETNKFFSKTFKKARNLFVNLYEFPTGFPEGLGFLGNGLF